MESMVNTPMLEAIKLKLDNHLSDTVYYNLDSFIWPGGLDSMALQAFKLHYSMITVCDCKWYTSFLKKSWGFYNNSIITQDLQSWVATTLCILLGLWNTTEDNLSYLYNLRYIKQKQNHLNILLV